MFVYLSKKIAIPNNVKLNCIAWNKEEGYIAVAGTEGLLKVLKLDQAANNGQNKGGLAAVSNLSMNQTLDGHKESVKVVTWNDAQQKLTSSDTDGVIMVWMLYKSAWYEEMTNDRKKSTVAGMSWTSDGAKICIVYEDGAIIVGSVDGNRIFGKELKNTHLSGVQWSPDNRLILFALANGECHLYDNQGNFAMKLSIKCITPGSSTGRVHHIASISWFSGRPANNRNRPVLAICYENGKVQIMRNENDDAPAIFDTNMRNVDAKWNHDGSVLAICGTSLEAATPLRDTNQVCFYSPLGRLYRTLKVPGSDITSLSWEGKSLRIAMAVDSFIYFANIRPDYIWCYFEKTVVFLNSSGSGTSTTSSATATPMNVITFWNTVSNQSFLKEVEPTLCLAASNEHCVLGVECVSSNIKEIALSTLEGRTGSTQDDRVYQLLLCNSIGTTVDSKYTDIKSRFVGINSGYVAIASYDEILIWHYHTPKIMKELGKNDVEVEQSVYDTFGSFVVILTTFFGVILARIVTHSICPRSNQTKSYFMEFPLIVLPGVFFVTIAAAYSGIFVALMIVLSIWFIWKSCAFALAKKRTKFYIGKRPIVLSVLRSMIQLITSICILAVDFKSFHRPYRKSEFFGAQLMDTGIGFFVFSMGFVSQRPQSRIDLRRSVFGAALPMILIGCVRTLLVILLNYHLAEHEYGRHLNAFFILGFTKLFGSLFGYLLSSDIKLLPLGIGILACHQEFLSRGISEYVESKRMEPMSLLDANRQGLFCIPGFVGMYLLAIYFSKWLRSKAVLNYREMLQKMWHLGLLSLLFWILCCASSYTFGICRVTCNVGYVCWIFALFSTMLTLAFFVFEFIINSVYPVEDINGKELEKETFNLKESPGDKKIATDNSEEIPDDLKDTIKIPDDKKAPRVTYVICESVNTNGLTFFLGANLFTALVNMFLKPDERSNLCSVAILLIYMFFNTFIAHMMYRKQSLHVDKVKK